MASSSSADINGDTATIADAPHILDPTPIKAASFLFTLNAFPNTIDEANRIKTKAIIMKSILGPRFNMALKFSLKPNKMMPAFRSFSKEK